MDAFQSLGLAEPIAGALASLGFAGPTRVQTESIPAILSRRDLFMESETGTGKTFAYLAPALQLLGSDSSGSRRGVAAPGVLVVAPTQELAVQIGREAERLAAAAGLPFRTAVMLGGSPIEKQVAKLRDRPDIVVGTLGRVHDLVHLRRLSVSSLRILILDEADRLFANETFDLALAVLKAAPAGACRALVSATLPERLRRELWPFLRDPEEVSARDVGVLPSTIEHWCFYCDSRKRLDFLRRFEAASRPERCLVFISAAARVEGIGRRLGEFGMPAAAIHAGLEKEARRVALERFARGEIRYLVTSDLGARGLDIPSISHVVSLDLPEEPDVYTHRAGRTGRAGAAGVSLVLADGVELSRASRIAVRGRFVFRCKFLEGGAVLEPSADEFFERAARAEEARLAAKAERVADLEARKSRGSRSRSGDEARPRRGDDSRARSSGDGPGATRTADRSARPSDHRSPDDRAPARPSGGLGRDRAQGRVRGETPTPRPARDRPAGREPEKKQRAADKPRPDRPASVRPSSERPQSRRPRADRPEDGGVPSERPRSPRPRIDHSGMAVPSPSERPISRRPRPAEPSIGGPTSEKAAPRPRRLERPAGGDPGRSRGPRHEGTRAPRPDTDRSARPANAGPKDRRGAAHKNRGGGDRPASPPPKRGGPGRPGAPGGSRRG